MADDSPVIIVVNNNIESNDSIPLLVEGVQLEEIPPATLEEHVTVSFCQAQFIYMAAPLSQL